MAAQLVRDTLLSQIQAHTDFTPEINHQAIEQCRLALHEAQGKNPKYSRMSTTLAALFIDRQKQRACASWCRRRAWLQAHLDDRGTHHRQQS